MDAIYRCPQAELYEACSLLAVNVREELGAFAGFRAKYTIGYVEDFEAAIRAAMALPDRGVRTTAHEVMRLALLERKDACIGAFNALRLYIAEAFGDPKVVKIRMEEAGYRDYDAARKANWEKLLALTKKALVFIEHHEAVLLANDNMPAGFKAAFEGTVAGLDEQVTEYLNRREQTKQYTQAKMKANNELYVQAMDICRDGYYLFADNEAKREQFVWRRLLALVTPPGAAGLHGFVKDGVTFEAVGGARVRIQKDGEAVREAVTDEKGRFDFGGLQAGRYTGSVEADGYAVVRFEVKLRVGVRSRKGFEVVGGSR